MALIRLVRGVEVRGPYDDGELTIQSPTFGNRFFVVDVPEKAFLGAEPTRPERGAVTRSGEVVWVCRGNVYLAQDPNLTTADVRALLNQVENRRRLELEKAHALQAMADGQRLASRARRQSIPQSVKLEVWQRDSGRCIECGSQERLEFDHVIPVALGGANTARNLQLLCEICNRRKGASLG